MPTKPKGADKRNDAESPTMQRLLRRGKLQWMVWCRENPKGRMRDEAWEWFAVVYGNGLNNRRPPGRWATERERSAWNAGYEDGQEAVKLSAQQLEFSF